MKIVYAATVALLFAIPSNAQAPLPQLGKDPIDKVIDALTDEEKVGLVMGTGIKGFGEKIEAVGDVDGRVPGAAGNTFPVTRLGIPSIVLADGPAGLRISPTRKDDPNTYYATAFPVGTALASTWNLSLVENVGKAMGNEVKEYGVDVLLAPALNIHRNPLCGRNFEYYSEDPIVSGKIAAAMVNGVESQGVGTSVKHFAANNQENNRMSVNAHVSERAMREIYLRGFEIAVKESQPWTIMSSYNKVDGQYTSARKDLLTDILRDEWDFKGLVMSDWFAGYGGWKDLKDNNFSSDVVAQLSAGNDLIMPGMNAQRKAILVALKDGKLSRETLDKNVKRVLELILESPHFKKYKPSNKPNLKQNAQLTREAATEGMVLLKNDGALPYSDKTKQLALFGTTSYNFISGGTGSGDVNEAYTISLLDGLKNAGFKINSDLEKLYVPYTADLKSKDDERRKKEGILALAKRFPELQLERDAIEKAAIDSDFAIITIGRNSGENGDRIVSEDFDLADDEQHLINSVSSAFHKRSKKVVVILNVGGVIESASWKDRVDAILLAWQPGQEGGNSVADVLSGKVNPSGKLTMTWPVAYTDVSSAKNFPGTPENDPQDVTYEEGIYVGYRYYQTFGVKPSYEFGFGKSYTSFEYSNLKIGSKTFKDNVKVSVTVKNTGKIAGKEVVQLYVSAPSKTIDKPKMELKAFTKTKLLKPGESETLTVTLREKDLASFVENKSAWVAEKGIYTVSIGASSSDIKQSAGFDLPSEITVEKTTKAFAQDKSFTELRP
ncbi:glycoside hydrolase family 3 C-terminal domain-containing protein [Flavobacterium sp. MAH-1]|uniref:Glycoside hydrolase family 3 C-terminal domain-containing protein n=1 Tax=Flavobacterium agri TaxID=2743471 RepID=A0A7Y8Y0J3_9FLAO|nr:glycoside hydrolase family 3 N-terminal domain-containing protein [Flavobacterium agri]NUY80217.1 glycoside hydrolase family 3 C-terminal domain-containing protein [Flavobacterium agri]NYA70242.1 glycoside hydrolase family 3 C-terminal domain-containing protein [Flavobacterium agri]